MSRSLAVVSAFCASFVTADQELTNVEVHARPRDSKHKEKMIVEADGQVREAVSSLSEKGHKSHHHDHHKAKTSLANPHKPEIELDATGTHAKAAHASKSKSQHHEHHTHKHGHTHEHDHKHAHKHEQHVKLHQDSHAKADHGHHHAKGDDDDNGKKISHNNPSHDDEADSTEDDVTDPYGDTDDSDHDTSDDDDNNDEYGDADDSDGDEDKSQNSTLFNDPLNIQPWDTETSSTFVPLELWLRILITCFIAGLGAFNTWWFYKFNKFWAGVVGCLWIIVVIVWCVLAYAITRQDVDDEAVKVMNTTLGPEGTQMMSDYTKYLNASMLQMASLYYRR